MQEGMVSMELSQQENDEDRATSFDQSQPDFLGGLSRLSSGNLNDDLKSNITTYFLANVNQLARVPLNDLVTCIKSLNIEVIKYLRKEIAFNLLNHHNLQNNYSLKPNSSVNTFSKEIYTLTQLCIKEKLSESDLNTVFKKITQTSHLLNENDLEDIFTSMEEIHIDVKNSNNQIKSLIDLIQIQSIRISTLQSENQALKSIVQNNNLMLKQIQSHLNIRNLNDDSNHPHTSHVPNTPKQPMYSTVLASGQNNKKETPRYKRPAQDSPPTNNDQSNKRTRSKSNSNPNKKHQTSYPTRPSTCPNGQTNIRTFDSTNSDDQSKPNDSNENDFKVAGPRKKSKKASIQKYIKTSGQGSNVGFKSCERKIEIYLGRISIDEKFENVKKAVGEIVSISSFDKITTIHSNFQSFKFTISVFDLDKIKDKNNWPRGVVIGRYKKPYAERVSQQLAESPTNTSSQIN